jgi:DUF1680 family protein
MYLYTGAADVAALTNNIDYMKSMQTVWEDVVYRNMYITGGIGSSGKNEGFTIDYDLPNDNAYCETCASVGMVFWNQRMNLLTGDSKYIDVLERSLYNGALDGLSLSGDRFFYGNPLASTGDDQRSEWFGTACCPSNISRLIASLGDYIYATSDDALWINLFVGSKTSVQTKNGMITVEQESNYPWQGNIKIKVSPDKKLTHTLKIRIPGWAQGTPVPGQTYHYLNSSTEKPVILINDQPLDYALKNGYVMLQREWKKGDVVKINLPMDIKRVVAIDSVKENVNRVALERGPILYCIEEVDNPGNVYNIILSDDVKLTSKFDASFLQGVTIITGQVPTVKVKDDGKTITTVQTKVTAIPYYTWANRGNSRMQVWLPRKATEVLIQSK